MHVDDEVNGEADDDVGDDVDDDVGDDVGDDDDLDLHQVRVCWHILVIQTVPNNLVKI